MAKYQKVLVAVDGSESSLHALLESFGLVGNRIVAVSVAPLYEGDLRLEGRDDLTALIREPCETALERARELAEQRPEISLKTICAVGEPYERIAALAVQEKCDLIVMGAKGHTLLERALLGSVTARVIGHASQDVLVVPRRARLGWNRLLVALDGSLPSRAAAARALDLAQAYGGELEAVSVLELPTHFYTLAPEIAHRMIHEKSWLQDLEAQAAARGVPFKCFAREGEPYREITRLAQEQEVSLIIMGSHGRTGLTRLLLGSVTERVMGHAPCPVLVAKTVSGEQ